MEAPAGNGEAKEEPRGSTSSDSTTLRDFIPIYIPGVERGAIDRGPRRRRFLDFLRARPSRSWLLAAGLRGRLSTFTHVLRRQDPASSTPTRRFRVPFVRKINWKALLAYGKNWIKHPMNMALCVWLAFVAAGSVLLGLLMLGLLDDAIPKSSIRDRWEEVVNQILNALFTIMCLYQHPAITHHLVILFRWSPKDAVELRSAYCKTPARRRHERAHMALVVALLHLTCLSQYMLCALYWAWTSKTRPAWSEYLCIGVGAAAPILAGLYLVYGPLGRKVEPEVASSDESESSTNRTRRVRVVVTEPRWIGGTCDCGDDAAVGLLSAACTFCVFGWNMERLGFGHMYVHIVTFVLLMIAPLLVFNVAALNISDDTTKYIVAITGCVLCFCGLMYGGYWRIQMRRRFRLPGDPLCCLSPSVTDCFRWLFCWACALAQEVRTGNYYEVEDDSVYRRSLEEEALAALEPLRREGRAGPRAGSSFDSTDDEGRDQVLSAPAPALIGPDEGPAAKDLIDL